MTPARRKTIKFARQFSSSSPLAVQVNTSYAGQSQLLRADEGQSPRAHSRWPAQ